MSAETKEIKGSREPDDPDVTIDRVERPPMDGPKPTAAVRWTAIVAGIVGFVCFVLTPFLPVVNTDATVSWPQNNSLNSVDAPLMAQAPLSLSVDFPLSLVDELPEAPATAVSTLPSKSLNPTKRGMQLRTTDGSLDVIFRDQVVLSLSDEEVAANQGKVLSIRSGVEKTEAFVEGAVDAEGNELRGVVEDDIRPQVTGIYTDLSTRGDAAAATAAGLDVQMAVDSRYTSKPTIIKYIVMWVGLLLTLASLWALYRIDKVDGSKHTPWFTKRDLIPRPLDYLVGFILVLWHFIGANTSDDGYIMTMARVSEKSGYMANYYRWFGVPESPFGSPYYDLLALMVKVSTSSLWMRLPALIAGLGTWFVISRLILPRLGHGISQRRVAYWSAAGVLLAFWLPFNNGIRPEPVITLGALLTWVFIERAILTRRLFPAAIGVIIATLSLGAGPTGLMAVAALLAGLPMLVRIVVERHRALGGGWSAPLMQVLPFLPAGTAILVAVFGDQTLATVRESIRVRGIIGPSMRWFEEPVRWYWLINQSVDGSFTRRFAVIMALTALLITIAALLRYRTVPGALAGPATRLVFVFLGTMFFMTFTPTKWTHHFGVYAGIGGALAALAAMAISHWVAGNRRNQLLFAGAMFFLLAFSLTGINGWWYVSSYGVPWFDKTIQFRGIESGNVVLIISLLVLVLGVVFSFIQEFEKPRQGAHSAKRRARFTTVAVSPIAVLTFLVVFFSVASMGKALVSQYPAYSVGLGNFRSLTGQTCNLAADVLMETDANKGFLKTVDGRPLAESLGTAEENTGFSPNGVATDLTADEIATDDLQSSAAEGTNEDLGAITEGGADTGTDGGVRKSGGANGSRAVLPFGLKASLVPVMGSYSRDVQRPSELETSWFELPEIDTAKNPLIVVTASGRIYHHDINGVKQYGQKLVAQYGRAGGDEDGFEVLAEVEPIDIGPSPSWRNLRFPTADIPEGATAVRLVAEDLNLERGQWLAVTPPRLAEVQPMSEVIDSETPVLPDWPVSFQFPCQRPFDHYAGVTELPEYRIMPDRGLKVTGTDTWQAVQFGGLLGISDAVNESVAVPTYLKDDWARDWGSVDKLRSRPNSEGVQPDIAEVDYTEVTRSGWYSPGQMIVKEP